MKIINHVLGCSFKVNILHLILIIEFAFVSGGNHRFNTPTGSCSHTDDHLGDAAVAFQYGHSSQPWHHLRIKINRYNHAILHVDLAQVKRVLANENLPVWISNQIVDIDNLDIGNGDELKRNYKVMNQLGKFTFYQEAKTSSAAVYFHKRREFDGMIGYEFLIEKLPIDKIHLTGETIISFKTNVVFCRPGYKGHNVEIDPDADNTVGVNYQGYMKTYEGHIYNGYPEILVIVSWSVAKYWTRTVEEADHYTTIVSRVLTLFNGVSMLYSKLKNTNIQINIAGIIIGTDKKPFSFLRECYHFETRGNKHIGYRLLGPCVNGLFARYLRARKNIIPQQSYDSVIFLTREHLFESFKDDATNELESFQSVSGTARCSHDLYHSRRDDGQVILVASATVLKHMGEYPIVAHEMAHLMTVLHDDAPYIDEGGKCSGHLMKPNSNYCRNCLSWSEISETTFKLFFSSPNCCLFINKPSSLNPPGQQKKLTADEQCRCYGYESAKVFGTVPENFCQMKLQCKGDDNVSHDTVTPMDGTPCVNDKVCWQMTCKDDRVSKLPDHQNGK